MIYFRYFDESNHYIFVLSIKIVTQRVEQVELQKFKKLGIVSMNMPRSCGNNKKIATSLWLP